MLLSHECSQSDIILPSYADAHWVRNTIFFRLRDKPKVRLRRGVTPHRPKSFFQESWKKSKDGIRQFNFSNIPKHKKIYYLVIPTRSIAK